MTASAAAALVACPVTAETNSSPRNAYRLVVVSARAVAVRGTSRISAISPNPAPGRAGPARPGGLDVHAALVDEVVAVAGVPRAEEHLARRERHGLERARELLDHRARQRREDRVAAQQLDAASVDRRGVETAQAAPERQRHERKQRARDDQRRANAEAGAAARA